MKKALVLLTVLVGAMSLSMQNVNAEAAESSENKSSKSGGIFRRNRFKHSVENCQGTVTDGKCNKCDGSVPAKKSS